MYTPVEQLLRNVSPYTTHLIVQNVHCIKVQDLQSKTPQSFNTKDVLEASALLLLSKDQPEEVEAE